MDEAEFRRRAELLEILSPRERQNFIAMHEAARAEQMQEQERHRDRMQRLREERQRLRMQHEQVRREEAQRDQLRREQEQQEERQREMMREARQNAAARRFLIEEEQAEMLRRLEALEERYLIRAPPAADAPRDAPPREEIVVEADGRRDPVEAPVQDLAVENNEARIRRELYEALANEEIRLQNALVQDLAAGNDDEPLRIRRQIEGEEEGDDDDDLIHRQNDLQDHEDDGFEAYVPMLYIQREEAVPNDVLRAQNDVQDHDDRGDDDEVDYEELAPVQELVVENDDEPPRRRRRRRRVEEVDLRRLFPEPGDFRLPDHVRARITEQSAQSIEFYIDALREQCADGMPFPTIPELQRALDRLLRG